MSSCSVLTKNELWMRIMILCSEVTVNPKSLDPSSLYRYPTRLQLSPITNYVSPSNVHHPLTMKFALLSLLLPLIGAVEMSADQADEDLPTLNVHIVPHTHDDVGEWSTIAAAYNLPLPPSAPPNPRQRPTELVEPFDNYLPPNPTPPPPLSPPIPPPQQDGSRPLTSTFTAPTTRSSTPTCR